MIPDAAAQVSVCVVGAGAVGGMLAVRLSLSGHRVAVVDRGSHLQAIRDMGLSLIGADGAAHLAQELRAFSRADQSQPVDLVILAVKAHEIAVVAPDLPALFHPETVVLTVQNGLPWWYFQRYGGVYEGLRLEALDPGGEISRHIPARRILGCVAYPAARIIAPGVVQHVEGDRFPLGELDGAVTTRASLIAAILNAAGFRSRVIPDIRAELWLKAWGALSFNPISALTGATMEEICRHIPTRDLAGTMMREAQEIAHALGITFRHDIARRIEGAEAVGAHKTSMLQDVEAGRPMEVDALIGSVAELGRLVGIPCPAITAIHACATLMNEALLRSAEADPSRNDSVPAADSPQTYRIG